MGTTAAPTLYVEKHKLPGEHQVVLGEMGQFDLNREANPELEAVVAAVRKR